MYRWEQVPRYGMWLQSPRWLILKVALPQRLWKCSVCSWTFYHECQHDEQTQAVLPQALSAYDEQASSSQRDLSASMPAAFPQSQFSAITPRLSSSTSSSFRSHTMLNTMQSSRPSPTVNEFHKEWNLNRKGKNDLGRDFSMGRKMASARGDTGTSTDVSASVNEVEGDKEIKNAKRSQQQGDGTTGREQEGYKEEAH